MMKFLMKIDYGDDEESDKELEENTGIDTDMELDTVHDTEEVAKKMNKNITTVFYETKQDDEVIDENNYYDAAEEADTEL